jgi:hypothetical protein
MDRKKPLYRRLNTRTHGVGYGSGGEYRWSRRIEDRIHKGAMRGKQRHGRDYTPLLKFLLSRVGEEWDAVYAEAVARLDSDEPIFWMVARSEAEKKPRFRHGENAYYSGLFVDEYNRLRVVDPSLRVENMDPYCACCTHTFNGVPFTRKYQPPAD